ncbi:MAG: GAF domain-containing protein [Anaerolineales bacterium]
MTPKKKEPSISDLQSDNQRLLNELEERDAELAVIKDVQEGMASGLDIDSIFELAGERIAEIFPGKGIALFTYDPTSNWGEAKYILEKGVRHYPPPFESGPIGKKAAETKQPLMLSTQADFEAIGALTIEGTEPSLSGIYTPLLVHDKSVGALNIESTEEEHAFTESDLRMVSNIASSLSVALENARLFDEVQHSNRELTETLEQQTATNDILHVTASSRTDVQPVLVAVAENAARLFDAIDVQIYRVEDDLLRQVAHCGPSPTLDDGETLPLVHGLITGRAVLERKTVHIEDLTEISASEYPESVKYQERFRPTRTCIATPLLREENAIGAIVVRRNEVQPFTEKQIALLITFAYQAAIAIENIRLFNETEQRAQELAIINSVQTALVAKLDIQAIYNAVGDKIHEIFSETQVVDILTYDPETNLVNPRYVIEKGKRFDVDPWPLRGFRKHIIETGQPLVINENVEEKSAEYDNPSVIVGESTKSWAGVPMIVGGEVKGVISLQHVDKENAFSDSDVRLLGTLANSMSVALENARLFDETQRLLSETEQRAAELQIINSVQEGLASKLEMQAIYDLVGDKIREIFNADTTFIAFHDVENNRIIAPYYTDKGERSLGGGRPYGQGLAEVIIESGERLLLSTSQEMNDAGAFNVASPGSDQDLNQSFLGVPIFRNGRTVGATSVQSYQPHAFDDNDLSLLQTLTNSMSVALENARLFDKTQHLLQETEERAAELATINTVGQALVTESDLDALIQLIGEQICKAFSADIVYVALTDEGTDVIQFPYTYGEEFNSLQFGEGLTGKIIETGEPLLINREMDKRRAEMGITQVGVGARSYLGVPIQMGGQTFGVISAQSTSEEGRFDQDDLHLLNTIAANVGTAIRNAQLFDEIKRQNQYNEAVIENSPAAIVIMDMEANVTGWNPAAEKLFGYTEAEALGKNVDDLVAKKDDIHAEAERFSEKALSEKQIHLLARRTRKDGSFVDVEVSGVPIAVDGVQADFIAIYHDVTELQRAREAAEQANQAKSTFLANMSHELRTPLNAIIGFTRIVRRKGEDLLPGKQIQNLDKVLISADHLLHLINSVLDISKIEAGRMDVNPETFELPRLINFVVGTSQPLFQKGVDLETDVQPDLLPLTSDQDMIKQILINLLSNAAKFTKRGKIVLTARQDGSTQYVDVSDTGIGISEGDLERIFEEFRQADASTTREYGGTGLGLSISRNLARLLGGDLTASSVEGEGSTFTLSIPVHYGDPSEELEIMNSQGTQSLTGQPLVVSIDDDPNVQ